MVKHCTKCRRKWIVSIMDKQEYYICPECEGGTCTYEIKRGKWTHGINENFRTCSACNISMGLSEGENLSRFKYCPFCGAKMEVEP